ncbi:MAG: radical SAM protein [Deltaproteobacteria bacterium]|nr:radical SAM protein [Deltaproteobacteria bacterium]
MVSITKLYCGAEETFDQLRYRTNARERKPVVVWNLTRRCNLFCKHCYAASNAEKNDREEISKEEAKLTIDDLSSFGIPVLLFSGGEPLLREDIFELFDYAQKKGIRTVLSTNGTLITEEVAKKLKKVGVSYVGISLDGIGEVNDIFRGKNGAFEMAKQGIINCKKSNIKVGIRFTINRENFGQIPAILDFFEKEGVDRICFYHLVYSGRGKNLMTLDLTHEERRQIMDYILVRAKEIFTKNGKIEVLTVDNHADGPYVYLKLLKEDPKRANEVYELLSKNEGNLSGIGIACIDESGNVYPDQFFRDLKLGNIRERPFSAIWSDESNEMLVQLRNKKLYIKGRCSKCKFLHICGGNFRARAYQKTKDFWAPDPQCYLTDEEIL